MYRKKDFPILVQIGTPLALCSTNNPHFGLAEGQTVAKEPFHSERALQRRVRRLLRELEALARAASRLEERLDGVVFDAVEMLQAIERIGLNPEVEPASRPTNSNSDGDLILRRLAESGSTRLEVVRRSAGDADVRIDGGEWFVLPRALTALLTALARDTGDGGGLVGWKEKGEIADLLAKELGERPSRGALDQLIWRLRKALRTAGVNPFLVQTCRHQGARFALRVRRPGVRERERMLEDVLDSPDTADLEGFASASIGEPARSKIATEMEPDDVLQTGKE